METLCGKREGIMVPSLEEMRLMSDLELLTLRTDISYDMSMIERQIQFDDDDADRDEDWRRRAMSAQHIRQHGVNAIKNIFAERKTERSELPAVPINRWLGATAGVVAAASDLLRDRNAKHWGNLEAAMSYYTSFSVSVDLLREAFAPS